MSRSYKKYPLFRDCLWGKSMKKGKQYFNRKLRRKYKDISIELPNGCYYRKLNNNHELYEYTSSYTEKEIIEEWYREQSEILHGIKSWKAQWLKDYTLKEAITDWKKSYKSK